MVKISSYFMVMMMLAGAVLTGCPAPQAVPVKVSVLFTASDPNAPAKATVVPTTEISDLFVTVEQVLLTPAGDPAPAPLSVLTAPQEVNLKHLLGVASLLDSAQIPAGTYTSMSLTLSSARLYLTAAPTTEITNVTLPDNGNFTVPVNVTVVDGQPNQVLVDLGGITLTALGNGAYELTPDFHVRVPAPTEQLPARAFGDITSVDAATTSFTVEQNDANLVVDYSTAVIFLPSDSTIPSGTPLDLAVGEHALAFGTLSPDGGVKANFVMILAERHDDDGESHGHHGGDDGEGEGHEGEGEDEGEGQGHEGESEGEDEGEGQGHEGETEGEGQGHEGETEGEGQGHEGEGEDNGSEGEGEGEGGHGGGGNGGGGNGGGGDDGGIDL